MNDDKKDYGIVISFCECPGCGRYYNANWNGICECGYINPDRAKRSEVLSDEKCSAFYEPDWIIA